MFALLRTRLGAVALVVVLALVGACGGEDNAETATEEQITLVFVGFGGPTQEAETKAWLEPFMEEHPNIKVIYDFTDYAKLQAMVQSENVTWNVVSVGNDFGLESHEHLLTRIDCNIVPCDELQPEKYPTTGYRVPEDVSGLALGYNTEDLGGRVPQGWADFFDVEKFPGKRVMVANLAAFPMEMALVGDGVDPANLYPLDIDRALRKIESLGDNLILTADFQECAELVGTGDAVMGYCFSGRFVDARSDGAPIEIQWNQNVLAPAYLVVPKGANNVRESMQLVAFALSAERNADFSDYIPYGPPNVNALDNVDASVREDLPTTYQTPAYSPIFTDDLWWDANRAEVTERWEEFLQGQDVPG